MKIALNTFSIKNNYKPSFKGNKKEQTQSSRGVCLNEMKSGDLNCLKPSSVLKLKNYYQNNNKQEIKEDFFFVRMKTYKKDEQWAKKMQGATYIASMLINNDADFDKILRGIEKAVNKINNDPEMFGVRSSLGHRFTLDNGQRGTEYFDRYLKQFYKCHTIKPRANEEYKDANTSKIVFVEENRLSISQNSISEKNLELVKKEYGKLKSIKCPTEDEINRSVATINWLIAQEMPYKKGNDSVASILTKAIYHAHDMELSPLKEGISLDFEAFDTNLEDYIERYPTFFEKTPAFIKKD